MKLQRRGRPQQLGGTLLGLILGLLVGVAVSLAVALYVTKVPVPFMNKVPQRTAEQDAAEAERNKNWDPNSPLYGKNPARPSSAPLATPGASDSIAPGVAPGITPVAPLQPGPILPGRDTTTPAPAASSPRPARDPASILSGQAPATTAPVANSSTPAVAQPSGSNTGTTPPAIASAKGGSDPFTYFVQAGAYSRTEEAEQQRAKLAMLGFGAKVTEREQAGRTVFRVRVGPYDKKDDADVAKTKIETAGVESALVRVQK
jgi:cell division protein FtsN